MHINPDHFLLTDNGRLWTPERSRQAWEQAYNQLERQLVNSEHPLRICLVMGVQGAGKSSWIRAQGDDSGILYFDAALPARHHRQRLIGIARQHDCPIEAVHIEVPLSIALGFV